MPRPQNPPRGTRDQLPGISDRRAEVLATAGDALAKAGYRELETPVFEELDVFVRSVGEASDIVSKEMYCFRDKGGRDMALRPEGTASAVRAYLANGLDRWPKPVKLWYAGPMFRYERSQRGRYRQFTQLGVECFGVGAPEADFEAIHVAWRFLLSLGVSGLRLELNSVGDSDTKRRYGKDLREFLADHREHVCPDCQRRIEINPLRALDCKVEADKDLYRNQAPRLADYLSSASLAHLRRLQELLDGFAIPYVLTADLVRGLDYYTDTVFEIKASGLGAQDTICAGGRYDGLVSQFDGPETPAFGWALGLERLLEALPSVASPAPSVGYDVFVVYPGDEFGRAYELVARLRQAGLKAGLSLESNRSPNKQFDLARKHGSRATVDLSPGIATLKNPEQLESSLQSKIWEVLSGMES